MSFSHNVEAMRDGSVDADGKVAVDDVTGDRIDVVAGVVRAAELDLPPVHHNDGAVADMVQDLSQVLTVVTWSRQVIPIRKVDAKILPLSQISHTRELNTNIIYLLIIAQTITKN